MARRWGGGGAFKEVTIRGEKVEIHVDTDGEFSGRIGLDYMKADTLNGLLSKLRSVANKTKIKVAVPATLLHVSKHVGHGYEKKYLGETCRRVTLTSINPKTNEVNFTFDDDGEKGSSGRRGDHRSRFGKPMTDDEIREWERLYKEKEAAKDRFRKFENKFTGDSDSFRVRSKPFDANEVVRAAIEKAHEEAKSAVEEDALEGDPRVKAGTDNRSRKGRRTPVLVPPEG